MKDNEEIKKEEEKKRKELEEIPKNSDGTINHMAILMREIKKRKEEQKREA
jgi:hypothetical protein